MIYNNKANDNISNKMKGIIGMGRQINFEANKAVSFLKSSLVENSKAGKFQSV